ncbi:PilT protein domain-containing protein [Cutibacterium granulosum DSM 20700]|uniref:PilT protein domain-containing protein n=2 Tax=Cutibacterium granulosum TaxID=33011 RepID=U1EU20_9ACTN|nr:PilT protein domain-containing protein [Cutibacterium granulosum DSM 20700]
MIAEINRSQPHLMAALLLETELRRMVHRCPQLSQDMVSSLLTKVSLYLIEPAQFTHAGLLPGQNLRPLDVLHLAAATDLGVDALVTYDLRLQSAAHEIGMPVVAPS